MKGETSTNETLGLLDKAERYLRSAELLRLDGDYDSAVSRLYYSMFFAATALLGTHGITVKSHRGVFASFGEHFIKTGVLPRETQRWLRLAFDKRQQGDYLVVSPLEEKDVTDLQDKARVFIDHIRTVLGIVLGEKGSRST